MSNDSSKVNLASKIEPWVRAILGPAAVAAVLWFVLQSNFGAVNTRIDDTNAQIATLRSDFSDLGTKLLAGDESVRNRAEQVNLRMDELSKTWSHAAVGIAKLQTDVEYLKRRTDAIAEKVQAAAMEPIEQQKNSEDRARLVNALLSHSKDYVLLPREQVTDKVREKLKSEGIVLTPFRQWSEDFIKQLEMATDRSRE